MKWLKLIINYLIGIATLTGVGFTIYFQFIHKDIIEIEVKTIDRIQLTKDLNIENLATKYLYLDSVEVNNLWKIRYVISNIGSKTIIARGNIKNILYDNLSISIKDTIRILAVNIEQTNFPISILKYDSNMVFLDFKQWKPTEYIDITAIIENFSESEPSFSIDERDIVDSKITYSEYRPSEMRDNKKLINYLPKGLANFLKWTILVVIIIIDIITIWAIDKQLKEDNNTLDIATRIIAFFFWLILAIIFSLPLLWMF